MQTDSTYQNLEKALQGYKPMLAKAADAILEQDVSSYPIFVLHRQGISIGMELQTEDLEGQWLVNASSLEEFVSKNLIESDRVNDFKVIYKDPEEFLCLFVIEAGAANFVFIPRGEV